MEVVPRGGPHRRLIPRRLENPEEADYTSQRTHFLLSSGRARLFAFEESNTRLEIFFSFPLLVTFTPVLILF